MVGIATLTRVPGVEVGHAEALDGSTGVTAILFRPEALVAAESRGGAPGTFHTDALQPTVTFGRSHGVFLTGGSVYGLDAGRGLRRSLSARGRGSLMFGAHDPLASVSGAVLFDLPRDRRLRADYERLGALAGRRANRHPVTEGSVGAGAGATVGKRLGRARACKGGLGTAAARIPGEGWVGALAVVNAIGDVHDPNTGELLVGARDATGALGRVDATTRSPKGEGAPRGTTLALVATDIPLGRRELARVAIMADDGIARAVVPAHTSTDGDTLFVASTRPVSRKTWDGDDPYPGARSDRVGILAGQLVVASILRGVRAASGTRDHPSYRDLRATSRKDP